MILEATKENIEKASDDIKEGNIVAFPTETVYGLGANGLDPIAVAKIFEAKNRPSFNPLILHLSKKESIEKICKINRDVVFKLVDNFWPGPLTLVLPKKEIVPDIVTAGHDTVAVRMPNHPVARKLIEKSECPIAAPSANSFGYLSPTSAKHVEEQLGDKVGIILDGGDSYVGVESTILQIEDDKIMLLRPGGLSVEELEKVVGKIERKKADPANPNAPGMLKHHYAPKVPIKFIDNINVLELEGKRIGGLFLKENRYKFKFDEIRFLSAEGSTHEAAANLFKYLHELESSGVDLILTEQIEEKGLGTAIMDRLKKAVNRYS